MTDAIRSELEEYVDAQQAAQEERASDCVSKKISHLMHTGKYSQDQAIAIAYSECEGRTLSEDEIARVAPLYADVIERACAPQPEDEQQRSSEPEIAVRRFIDRAVETTDVEGVIRGFIGIWGNPECVRFAPGVNVSWGSGDSLQYGRVAELLPGDALRIELHRMNPGREWTPLGSFVDLPRLSVRATDQHGTWFDRTRPPEMGLSNGMHRRPILIEHASSNIGVEIVGTITQVESDAEGIHFDAELDRSLEVFPQVIDKIRRKVLKTSSATMEHTAVIRADGSFEKWILGEHTLTEWPSENRMPPVALIRSASQEEVRAEPRAGDEPHDQAAQPLPVETKSVGEKPMGKNERALTPELTAELQQWMSANNATVEDIAAFLQSQQPQAAEVETEDAPVAPAMSAAPALSGRSVIDQLTAFVEAKRAKSDIEAIRAEVNALKAERNAPPAQQPVVRGAQRPGEGVNVNVIEAQRFARFSHDEMFLAAQILTENGVPTSEGFRRSLAHRGLDYVQKTNNPDTAVSAIRSAYTRADDFMASDIAGKGAEWVGTMYGSEVWKKARTAPIMDMLIRKGIMQVEVPDGASNAVIPLEGSDPTVYTTAQSNDADATGSPEIVVGLSYAGTSSATVTPGELTTAVPYTDILSEDSVLQGGLVAQLNFQINEVMIRQPEYVFINGDTTATASTNINLIDGTPGTGINKPAYMVSDGALKLALVTNSAMSRDGGTLDDEDFRITTTLFDGDIQSDPDRTAFVLDPYTYSKTLSILAMKTRDVAGVDATLFTGKVPPILGIDVFRSGQMAKANSAGKIPAAGGTLGRILAVYAPYWALVWKRRMTIENARVALAKSNVIIASMRLGFRYRATNASAVSYNLTV